MIALREILKSSDSDYYSRFQEIESSVISVMSNTRFFFPTYTNHDFKHLNNVEDIINSMLTEEVKEDLSYEEIFCLLSATWLHDIGMIPVNNEKEEYDNKTPEERKQFAKNVRFEHNIRSKCYIENHKEELNLDDFESDIIGNICKGHRQVDLGKYGDVHSKTKVRLASLSAILRLADECDVSHNRETTLSQEGVDEETLEEHYKIHELVRTPVFDHENKVVKIVAMGHVDKDKSLLIKCRNKIQSELDNIIPYLKKIGVDFNKIELDCRMDKNYIKKKIILSILNDEDICSNVDNEWIYESDIVNCLEELKCDKKILENNNKYSLTEDIELFKEIFKMFLNEWMGDFFFTEYVEDIIGKSIYDIEKKFRVKFDSEERQIRINLLKNYPTAIYILLFIDEIINYPSFNLNSLQDGELLFDSIISMGMFNDIHRYSDNIHFENIYDDFKNLKFYDNEEVKNKINFYKVYSEG
ncbi:HD domain-containing protein [Methanobrevibacter gottschalkii]|nr:HD domain-containing protein [Methanobrevibacter gottschalkii]